MKVVLESLDRRSIRKLVEKQSAELRSISEVGGNFHQRHLDQQDQIDEYIATLNQEERLKFLTIYAQETEAQNKATADKIEELRRQQTRDIGTIRQANEASEEFGRVVVGIIVLIVVGVAVFLFLQNT